METAQVPGQSLPEHDQFNDEKVFLYIQPGPLLFQLLYIFLILFPHTSVKSLDPSS